MDVTDICEICDREIISCLKQRFINDEIYVSNQSIELFWESKELYKYYSNKFKKRFNIQTYIAKVLIAINPYHQINGMYSPKKIEAYYKDTKDELPPHLFSIGEFSAYFLSGASNKICFLQPTGSF